MYHFYISDEYYKEHRPHRLKQRPARPVNTYLGSFKAASSTPSTARNQDLDAMAQPSPNRRINTSSK